MRFHHGTAELLGRVALAADAADDAATDSTDEQPRITETRIRRYGLAGLQPGRRAFARIRLEAPAVLTRGDRFILRQYSPPVTIGGGRVLDPVPARTPIRTAAARRGSRG